MSMNFDDCATIRQGFPRPSPDTPANVLEQLSMSGKVTVVTGAADGLGYAVAEAIAEAGGDVAFWYNSNDAAVSKAKALGEQCRVRTAPYQVDVSDPEQVQKAMAKVVQDFGKIHVFVANAGNFRATLFPCFALIIDRNGHFEANSRADFVRIQSANVVNGVVYCAKYAGQVFKSQGFGNLIITSSMSGHIVNVPTDQPVYNGTKAFVTHFGKSLAREWRDFARVNIVSPGFFDTKMGASPAAENEAYRMAVLGRQGHVKEIKGIYLYLASSASSYTTGSDILVDGGYVLP
ncbi:short-chain dehydrogenase [Beauveria brongniartii RCEF 3172]|uniref:Short-chain dehydrogenase n=1 Tax=Beauveria brongniartii RCEF 3172 TaxID=1081107 RepID=A0A166WN10_9HYPO|nr:short-chain dehydrogenase [Beauveria brongniartii RCEF 3172]